MKKFVVGLIFTVDATEVFDTERRLEHFLHERGYFFFNGETETEYIEDVTVEAHEMSITIHEIDC